METIKTIKRMTTAQYAAYIGRPYATVKDWIDQGYPSVYGRKPVPYDRVGRLFFIHVEDMDRLIASTQPRRKQRTTPDHVAGRVANALA